MELKPNHDVDPAAVAADLRAIAGLVESDPYLATLIATLFKNSLWPVHAVAYDQKDEARAVFAEVIRQLKPIATGVIEKHYDSEWFNAVVPLQALKLSLTDSRAAVCTRVVTGVEAITEEVPDPEALAAVPKITRTREVETVEWKCGPLLAADRDGAAVPEGAER